MKAKSKKVTKKTKNITQPKLSAEDRVWQAEDDARILAQARAITSDKVRLSSAKTQAKKMIVKQQKDLQNLKKVIK